MRNSRHGSALAFGLTVLTMAYAVGGISGGHFNPAVSLGLALANRFSWKELIPYWVAQVVGAAIGAVIWRVLLSPGEAPENIGNEEFVDVSVTHLEIRN